MHLSNCDNCAALQLQRPNIVQKSIANLSATPSGDAHFPNSFFAWPRSSAPTKRQTPTMRNRSMQ